MLNDILNQSDLENFLLSLSEAVDFGSNNLAHHLIRTSYIAYEISRKLGFALKDLNEITLSALFHDIGALSYEKDLLSLLKEFEKEDFHCKKGEIILRGFPGLKYGPIYVRYHHTPYDELSKLGMDKPLVLGSQILFISDYVERYIRSYRVDCILTIREIVHTKITEMFTAGKIVKDVFDAFLEVSRMESFWLNLNSRSIIKYVLSGTNLMRRKNMIRIADILTFIVNLVDIKSNFTIAHSSGVSVAARNIGSILGLGVGEVEELQFAGYLHDIGKIAVPSRILNKKGKLTREEYLIVQRHPYYTYRILNSVGSLIPFSYTAFHHENDKGTGYPFGFNKEYLDYRAKIISAADLFTALYEDRPYRKRLSDREIKKIFKERASSGLMDKKLVKKVTSNFGDVAVAIRDEQEKMKEWYHRRFKKLEEEDN